MATEVNYCWPSILHTLKWSASAGHKTLHLLHTSLIFITAGAATRLPHSTSGATFSAASTSPHVKTCEGQRGEQFIFPFTAAVNCCFQFPSPVKCLCTIQPLLSATPPTPPTPPNPPTCSFSLWHVCLLTPHSTVWLEHMG